MDAEIKRKWVEALRSGEYAQAQQCIRSLNCRGLCCIGVGYSVLHPDVDMFAERMPTITSDAARELGLTMDQKDALVTMNDREDKSFAEIADYIERHL